MNYNAVFVALIGVLLFGYVLDRILDALNLKHILPELPRELSGIFDQDEYKKSQLY
jgi:STE24 endopeptidase